MTPLDHLTEQLERHEGFRAQPYWDGSGEPLVLEGPKGIATIGMGRNLVVGITEKEARILLSHDMRHARDVLNRYLPKWLLLPAARRNVLVNMVFNMGWGNGENGLSSFKNLIDAIRWERFDEVPEHMADSKWARQVGDRSVELIELWRTNQPA